MGVDNKPSCYINGIEYPLLYPLRLTDHAAAASTSTITVDIRGLPEPQALDTVYIFDSEGYLVFGGVAGCPRSPQWTSSDECHEYSIEVNSMNNLLTRRYVNKAWVDSSIYEIVLEIYDKIISQENTALGTISAALEGLPKQKYIAPDMTAYDVLNELSELVGAVWNIEVNRASTLAEYLGTASEPLQFYATATGPAPAIWAYDFYDTPSFKPFRFTFLVRDDFPILPAPADCWGLQKMVESYNLRTVQVVKGATGVTDPQIETFTYKAGDSKISVQWPIVDLPTITVNGVSATVGVNGLDSDNSGKQFLFSYNSADININTAYEPKLAGGEKIVVNYRGHFSLRIRLANQQMIQQVADKTRTSGLIESVDTNDRYGSAAELISYASTQLYSNTSPETQITLSVDDLEGTEPFTIWSFAWPEYYVVGEYVVVERSIVLDSGQMYAQVKLKDKGFLTAYGKTFLRQYANNPTDIRDTEVVVASDTVNCSVALSCSCTARIPLVCHADDGQPWMWGGDYYASY